MKRMKALYAGEVTMVDRWLGRFLDKMEETGRMEDTFLVVLADHGVALGEHGFTGKPYNALWPELTDIPFFIRSPDGKGAGETSDYRASTYDVASTIVGALGLLPPQQMDGQYLTLLTGGSDPEPRSSMTSRRTPACTTTSPRTTRTSSTKCSTTTCSRTPGARCPLFRREGGFPFGAKSL
jgi:arylsulfatase A-like enzyme